MLGRSVVVGFWFIVLGTILWGVAHFFSHKPFSEAIPGLNVSATDKQTFLVPDGFYTVDDIARNGRTSPAIKYPDFLPRHREARKGEYICPFSQSAADTSLSWWINGQRYFFCCVPCIAEAVKMAKHSRVAPALPTAFIKR